MEPIRVQQQSSYVLSTILLSAGSIIGLCDFWQSNTQLQDLTIPAILMTFSGLFGWLEWIRGKRWIEINSQLDSVSVHSTSVFFSRRTKIYPLKIFGSIRSFTTINHPVTNRIELVTKPGGEALLVTSLPTSKFTLIIAGTPIAEESIQARSIREQIAAYTKLNDIGFIGARLIGAQLE